MPLRHLRRPYNEGRLWIWMCGVYSESPLVSDPSSRPLAAPPHPVYRQSVTRRLYIHSTPADTFCTFAVFVFLVNFFMSCALPALPALPQR